MRKLLKIAILAATAMFTLAACSDNSQKSGETSVSILYPSWAEGVAMTNLAKVVLEERDINVKATLIEPGPLYASLAKGDADLYLDAWLPHTHKDYWARFGEKLDVIGTIFDDASTGLVVPDYVSLNSIEELNAHAADFHGKIYGIGSGAGVHTNTIRAIDEYDLSFEQITSSESSMMAELRRSIAAEEPVVITGWKPHYMWDLYDLKMLDDPKSVYEIDKIHILSRKGFSDDQPDLAYFFGNFVLDSDKLHELMGMVGEDERDPTKGAKVFYDKYKTEIDAWFPEAL